MSTEIKPGRQGRAVRDVTSPGGTPIAKSAVVTVTYYGGGRTFTASMEDRINLELQVKDFLFVPVYDATPAPLDPSPEVIEAVNVLRDAGIRSAEDFDRLVAHQPAPKPEWKPGTLAIVTPSMWGGIVNRALRGGDGNWHTEGGGFWSDDEVADVHELVVIDPAEVDVDALAKAWVRALDESTGMKHGGPSRHAEAGIRAVLAQLGIEVAR